MLTGGSMATYTLQKLPGESIIFLEADETWQMETDVEHLADEINPLMDRLDEPAFFVVDALRITTDVHGVIIGTTQAARVQKAFLHHPNLRGLLIVAGPLVRMASLGLRANVFGNIAV